jgi:hypothetical protein
MKGIDAFHMAQQKVGQEAANREFEKLNTTT